MNAPRSGPRGRSHRLLSPPAVPRLAAPLLLALWTFALVAAMLTPSDRLPDAAIFTYDKLLHLASFAVWAVLAAHALPGRPHRILAPGLLLAVGTELAQQSLPRLNRSGEVADGVADAVGLLIGLWLAGRAAARRRQGGPARGAGRPGRPS